MPNVTLPPKTPGAGDVLFENLKSMVILGANGSGKSRLGAEVERRCGASAHRVSAQRALNVPALVQPIPLEQASTSLFYGRYDPKWDLNLYMSQRDRQRWKDRPTTGMLDDFAMLLALLFASERRRDREYTAASKEAAKAGSPTMTPRLSELDRIKEIWAKLMPHRSLEIQDDKIVAHVGEGSYGGEEMSDGERVVVYLLGQALCAPKHAIFIIDEPEIHVHRAIQAALWDEIEKARPDCTFVYITHDLEFASTRIMAKKIWIKAFSGTSWEWEEVPSASELPEELLFQVLGSRRPVVFVEGTETSLDTALYSALFPAQLVLPRHGCDAVVQATRAVRGLEGTGLHHVGARGIVDRDRRSEAQVAALRSAGVAVAEVAEVENLFCLPEAIQAAAAQLKIANAEQAVRSAQQAVLAGLWRDLELQSALRGLSEIQYRLSIFAPRIGDGSALTLADQLDSHVKTIDVQAVVGSARTTLTQVLTDENYLGALKYYNSKGIPALVASALGVSARTFLQVVLGVVRDEPEGPVATAMRTAII